jgi:hypothetical protein
MQRTPGLTDQRVAASTVRVIAWLNLLPPLLFAVPNSAAVGGPKDMLLEQTRLITAGTHAAAAAHRLPLPFPLIVMVMVSPAGAGDL